MLNTYSGKEWFQNAERTYALIVTEMETVSKEHLSQAYPKFVVMYEYFRLLRGEAFLDHRGPVTPDEQRRLYEMENEIAEKINAVRKLLDPNDGSTKYHIDEMKKHFDL